MKAYLLYSPAPIETRPLKVVEVDKPTPADDELLVRVSACGIVVMPKNGGGKHYARNWLQPC